MKKKTQCPHCLESFKIILEPVKAVDPEKKKVFLASKTIPYEKFRKVAIERSKYKNRLKELGEI